MDKKIIEFDDIEIEECKFYHYNSPILMNHIDINKISVFNKFPLVNNILNISLVTKIIKN